jgi:hypothetical protein
MSPFFLKHPHVQESDQSPAEHEKLIAHFRPHLILAQEKPLAHVSGIGPLGRKWILSFAQLLTNRTPGSESASPVHQKSLGGILRQFLFSSPRSWQIRLMSLIWRTQRGSASGCRSVSKRLKFGN